MLKEKTALITGASRGMGKNINLTSTKHESLIGINYHTNEKTLKGTSTLGRNIYILS